MTEVGPIPASDPATPGTHAGGARGRIGRGLAANVGGIGVTLVIQLVSVPVLLAAWGVSTYGEWLVLSAVPTYVALSDLSFSSVAGNSMVMLEAAGKHSDAIALGRRLWSIVTVTTGVVVLTAVAIALVFGNAFGSETAIPSREAQVVLVALFLQVAIGNQYGVLDAWYRTGGRYPLGTLLRNIGRLIEFGALMASVLLRAGPGAAAIAFLVGSAVGFGVSWVVLRRTVPWATFRPERPDPRTFRELLAPGLAFMAFPVGNALSLQGFTIVISATMGAAAVVAFSTTRTITRVAIQAMASIRGATWPELSRSVGSGRIEEARVIMRRSVQLALVASLSLVLGLALFGVALVQWWTRGLVDPPVLLLSILLLVIVANSMWYTLSAVLLATNLHKRMAVVYVASTTTALVAGLPLSSVFGLAGAGMALLAIDMAMVVCVFPAALSVVQDTPMEFLRALLDFRGTVRSAIGGARSPV